MRCQAARDEGNIRLVWLVRGERAARLSRGGSVERGRQAQRIASKDCTKESRGGVDWVTNKEIGRGGSRSVRDGTDQGGSLQGSRLSQAAESAVSKGGRQAKVKDKGATCWRVLQASNGIDMSVPAIPDPTAPTAVFVLFLQSLVVSNSLSSSTIAGQRPRIPATTSPSRVAVAGEPLKSPEGTGSSASGGCFYRLPLPCLISCPVVRLRSNDGKEEKASAHPDYNTYRPSHRFPSHASTPPLHRYLRATARRETRCDGEGEAIRGFSGMERAGQGGGDGIRGQGAIKNRSKEESPGPARCCWMTRSSAGPATRTLVAPPAAAQATDSFPLGLLPTTPLKSSV